MNLSPVYTCFLCLALTRTTDAQPKLIPDFIRDVLSPYLGRTSSSLDPFQPTFMDLRNNYHSDPSAGACDGDAESIQCDPTSPYRTYDGACNNLAHPEWGRTSDCFLRFLRAAYEGQSGLRRSVRGGRPLPLVRDLSVAIFLDRKYPTRVTNFLFTVFGQLVSHDSTNARRQSASGSCCSPPLSANSTLCAPIIVRPDDPFYSQFDVTCLDFVRSAPCPHCNGNGKWQQSLTVTAAVDGSVIYGSTKERALSIRTFDGTGRLKSETTVHGELPPRPSKNEDPPLFCPMNQKEECFVTGDVLTNMHAALMSIHTSFLREHNRVADALRELNPHWGGEALYQEARRIVVAEFQNIVYSEYLPWLLGPKHMSHYNLSVQPADGGDTSHSHEHGTYRNQGRSPDIHEGTSYDPDIRLGIWDEFTAAVFRLHSMVPTKVGLGNYRFRDYYSCPQLVRDGKLDGILSGASGVPSEKMDPWFTKDVSDYLLKQPGSVRGEDLASIDLQRGRDHGMPPYVSMLKYLSGGKMNVTEFEQLSPIMTPRNIQSLKEHYADVRDVDLYAGVVMEDRVPDSNLGPTAAAIVGRQFYVLKYGDRFYFEHEGEAPSFTPEQRESLRTSSLSRILCDSTGIPTIPKNSLLLESVENPVLSCDQIPKVDLGLWKTFPH